MRPSPRFSPSPTRKAVACSSSAATRCSCSTTARITRARAARAAFEMRRTLRAIGRPRTSAGAIQLKMHAGLHSGRFQFFLVGESHRELLVAGPAASRTVEMEAASEAGEILLSPETAALLDADTLGEEKGRRPTPARGARRPGRRVAPLPDVEGHPARGRRPGTAARSASRGRPARGRAQARVDRVHSLLGNRRGDREPRGPRRPPTRSTCSSGPSRPLRTSTSVTFLESDVDRDGGRIILVSGAPQTFGDDEERMLRTVRAIVDAGLPLPVHIGVSEGRVFTGQVGASFRQDVHRARRHGGTGRASHGPRGRGRDLGLVGGIRARRRQLRGDGARALRGEGEERARPGGRPRRPPARDGARATRAEEKLPFVDRERERAVLAASVAPVRMGFGTLVELVGEPGIGKSRLAQELRENCADMRQVSLRCEQYEASTPYYAVSPLSPLAPRRRAERGRRNTTAPCSPSASTRSTRSSFPGRPSSRPRSTSRSRQRPR